MAATRALAGLVADTGFLPGSCCALAPRLVRFGRSEPSSASQKGEVASNVFCLDCECDAECGGRNQSDYHVR